jgi:hypothetical protein
MQLTNVFKPVRLKGRILAKNVVTGEIAAKGMIRDTQLRTAEANHELCIVSASGRITRIPAIEFGILPEKAAKPKLSFMTARAEIDPAIMFANIERLTKMVGKGIQPSLVITGSAGTGKTHLVKSTLAGMGLRESFEFVHFKGRATAAGLFVTLYENCDKIIILDDCDSVFKDADAVNILKGALDSYDTRNISYITTKPLKDEFGAHLPRTFEFTGKIIFISNIAQSSLDEAIRSRSFVADVDLTKKQKIRDMKKVLNVLGIILSCLVMVGPIVFVCGGMRDIRTLQMVGGVMFVVGLVFASIMNLKNNTLKVTE